MNSDLANKSKSLLTFLRATATLRRKRIPAYGRDDKVLWFCDVPTDRPECHSPFNADEPGEMADLWLEVRKKRMPIRPVLPEAVNDWIRPQDLDQVREEPDLLTEITVLVEKNVPDPGSPPDSGRTVIERVPEVQRLQDHPEVQDAWLEYLVNRWSPWAKEMRRWQEAQQVYEDVDYMHRRLEEAEERYELVMGIGLLQWRDPNGTAVKRHLLTAPAEISLDAARGVLTVVPAASFETFRIEVDMLELGRQPRLEGTGLEDLLEDLDIQAWDRSKVGKILRIIANRAAPDVEVDENSSKPFERTDESFRVVYAPALVLRERRPTSYEELIARFLQATEGEPTLPTTQPWERFLLEGEQSPAIPGVSLESGIQRGNGAYTLYFPRPANEEQKQIAERLSVRPQVLVKGPPGTGKSLTIANLICHLLANGERVLVTAHAQKALTVLRDKLPDDVRSLCVTALGSTREDQRLLENSVRGILSRKNEWRGAKWAEHDTERLEQQLKELQNQGAKVDRQLRDCREAETHTHTLWGGYHGTAARIARRIEEDRESFGWLPDLSKPDSECPLNHAEIEFLTEIHVSLSAERLNELRADVGDFPLPDPQAFKEAVQRFVDAERSAEEACADLPQEELGKLQHFPDAALEACRTFLNDLEPLATRASRVLGNVTEEILKDLLVGREERWSRLAKEAAELLKSAGGLAEQIGRAHVEPPANLDPSRVLVDAHRRLDHFQKGGRQGWGFLAPRVVRETAYLEGCCRIDGQALRGIHSLETLVAFLKFKGLVDQFCQTWPIPPNFNDQDPRLSFREADDLAQELDRLLSLFRGGAAGALGIVPAPEREALSAPEGRNTRIRIVEAEIAKRQADRAGNQLEAWKDAIRVLPHSPAHACMAALEHAIDERDPQKWNGAWEKREALKAEKARFGRYSKLCARLEAACPGLEGLLDSNQGNPDWKHRLSNLDGAWAWAAARAWLLNVVEGDAYLRLENQRHQLTEKIERKIEELAALKAWRAFFNRLDEHTEQSLTAWTRAVSRIGGGKGIYAYRHRRTARKYLMECIPKVPAWIMPLHKLWETIDPTPGVFDTAIVDEASQAGVEALALLLLAKRIIVVGDDKQNSPEAVGVREDDIARLARDHLREFRFRDEFRPDTSLFDHAERAFGNLISLREHFRCVPEIIRFSNDLCYTDAPLIPLRQAPPNRLSPLRTTFVNEGSCEGEGQRIINRAEAERIVETIRECIADEAYEGKTMGVIILQGHAQAEVIEKMLVEALEPKVREERKLRCGVPATFQGDERDVIFLSLVIAPNHSYRALTGPADQRRFNVGASRAKDQMWLFHSVRQSDLSRDDLRWKLLHYVSNPGQAGLDGVFEELERLEREARRTPRQMGEQPDPYESWFEVDVALQLLRRKYRLRPQYDAAGYRIDIVVEGLDNRLAVECDGDAWHGAEEYEHDMARQLQLVRAGWAFVRIRESEFYANRSSAVQQIVDECEQMGIRPTDQEEETELSEPEQNDTAVLENAERAGDDERLDHTQLEDESLSETEPPRDGGALAEHSTTGGFPDPREASPANVRAALGQIIQKEGPLNKALIFRLYVEGCPSLSRAGKTVRSALNRALWAMQKASKIQVEDELGDRSIEGQVIRLAGTPKVRERRAGARELHEIPPSELCLVFERLAGSAGSATQDGEFLSRAVLEQYGYSRLTEKRRAYLAKVLERWHSKSGT